MEEIIKSIRLLFTTYGFRASAIVLLTIIIVNLLKKPIVKKAERVAQSKGVDKSVITKYITLLPMAVALILNFIATMIIHRFDFLAIDYGETCASAILYAAIAVATYESVKKQLEAYAAKSSAKANNDDSVKINFSTNGQ